MKWDWHAVAGEATRASPPLGVTGAQVFGLPVSEAVLWATLVYTVWLVIRTVPSAIDAWLNLMERIKNGRKQ